MFPILDTSGLVLFARTTAARDALKAQFARHSPERIYLAIVIGRPSPESGTWRDMLAWDPSFLRQRKAHGSDARDSRAGRDAGASAARGTAVHRECTRPRD